MQNRNNKANLPPTLLYTEQEAAKQLRVSLQQIRLMRERPGGPKYFRIGRLIRYNSADLEAWCQLQQELEDQRVRQGVQ